MRRFVCIFMLVLAVIALSVSCNQEPDSAKRPNHSHSFTEENVSDKYLKSAATCTSKAVYYKSCSCGVKGSETFESGKPLAHVFTAEIAEDSHLASAATCTAKATYYKSCTSCGANGTETFESGETGSHSFVGGVCSSCGEYQVYAIGSAGPAGGFIFYDCDADNTEEDPDGADNLKSDVCGWRYLEAAPENVTANGAFEFGFGYWRDRSNGTNLTVDTLDGFGTGKQNTADIVQYLGDSAYMYNRTDTDMYDKSYQYNEVKSGDYAARLASNYVYEQVSDWFLPSGSELYRMCNALSSLGVGGFENGDYYWSSSEASTADSAWGYKMGEQSLRNSNKSTTMHVRPVRSF